MLRIEPCVYWVQLYVLSWQVISDSVQPPWTIAHQAPLSMEFSRKNNGVGCHFLLQRIFPTQGSVLYLLCLLHSVTYDSLKNSLISCDQQYIMDNCTVLFLKLWNDIWHHISFKRKVKVKSLRRVWLFATPWTVAYQVPLSMGFSRQEYWSGFPFPSAGALPDPGTEARSPAL